MNNYFYDVRSTDRSDLFSLSPFEMNFLKNFMLYSESLLMV